jgi:hypothetical protein
VSDDLTPRDVIARVLAEASDDRAWVTERSDAAVAALDAAGWSLTRKPDAVAPTDVNTSNVLPPSRRHVDPTYGIPYGTTRAAELIDRHREALRRASGAGS